MLLTHGHSHHKCIFPEVMGSCIPGKHDLLLLIYPLNVDSQIWGKFRDL